jgi:putative membrane protein
MDGGGFMFPGLGLILTIVVIAALIWAVSRGFSAGGTTGAGRQPGGPPGETALDVLKGRYAAGEIDKDEYERIKRDIES